MYKIGLAIGLAVLLAIAGWALFFGSITGQTLLQFENPIDPGIDANFVVPPTTPGLSPQEAEVVGCSAAKEVRIFVCDVYTEKYGGECGFFSGKCKGVRELCELAQENVEDKCSFSD